MELIFVTDEVSTAWRRRGQQTRKKGRVVSVQRWRCSFGSLGQHEYEAREEDEEERPTTMTVLRDGAPARRERPPKEEDNDIPTVHR